MRPPDTMDYCWIVCCLCTFCRRPSGDGRANHGPIVRSGAGRSWGSGILFAGRFGRGFMHCRSLLVLFLLLTHSVARAAPPGPDAATAAQNESNPTDSAPLDAAPLDAVPGACRGRRREARRGFAAARRGSASEARQRKRVDCRDLGAACAKQAARGGSDRSRSRAVVPRIIWRRTRGNGASAASACLLLLLRRALRVGATKQRGRPGHSAQGVWQSAPLYGLVAEESGAFVARARTFRRGGCLP